MSSSSPIGVFDSGLGGLTVYEALRRALPDERFVYLGDTARLPYGMKSAATVTQYVHEAAQWFLDQRIKLLVIACNTASALALASVQKEFPDLPCFGVIEPGALAAAMASQNGEIVLLATSGTVRSGAYPEAIQKHKSSAKIHGVACNLLVSLVEEGWWEGAEAEAILRRYLRSLEGTNYDTVVLGCTHFPLIAPELRKLLPEPIKIVDSATATAEAVRDYLNAQSLAASSSSFPSPASDRFCVTDAPERFHRLATRFLSGSEVKKVKVGEG